MSHHSTQPRSRSNPPPTHRSQLPILYHTTRPDGYRMNPALSPRIPTRGYPDAGEPIQQSPHISYPTHVLSDSGSSDSERILPEQTKTHSTLRRRLTGKRKTSGASGLALDPFPGSRHRRKGSGPEDLALLETHILPSLSKTVDRITKNRAPVLSSVTPDPHDNAMLLPLKSSRLPSKLPSAKPPSQPSTPKPILKPSMRTPTTPTISSFTPANNSLRSVKGFSPSPKSPGVFNDLTPTFSPTSLLSERPPAHLSPQEHVLDISASYHSTPKTPSRRPAISQRASPRPSYVTMDYLSHHPKSPNHTLDYSTDRDSITLMSPITAERAPWDEVFSEARHLGNHLSTTSTNPPPQKPTVSPRREEFRPSDRVFETHRGSVDNPGGRTPGGDDAALQRKRRETLLAIVEGVNSHFDSGAPARESSEYSGYVGVAIGSGESTFGEGMANLRHPSGAEQFSQGTSMDRGRPSSLASRQVYPGEERQSWYERHLGNDSPRASRDTDHVYQESRRYPPSCDPATQPKLDIDAQMSRRSPARNSSEPTHPVRAPSHLDYPSQPPRESKRRSISTPPVARRSHTDPTRNVKKRESGNLLPRTRSSLFLPTSARAGRPTSGDGLEAFGLPPSLSYVFRDTTGRAGIVPAESGKSLDDQAESWKRGSDVRKNSEGLLSSGAERLFQALADKDTDRASSSPHTPYRLSQESCETPTQPRRASMPVVRSDFSIASMSSAPSVYDDQAEEYEEDKNRRTQEPTNLQSTVFGSPHNWRSTISPSIYNSLTRLYGEAEMQRQEAIFEICNTEALFVQRLRTVLRLFIRPLRAQDTSTWISGVPGSIARLFDWFEDIMNLHVEINTELKNVRSENQSVVERFAGILRKFVPRFEVYQPYLIRVEGVLGQLRGEADDDVDGNLANFREFVGIQEREEDCEGWSLQNLLLEPIHRLAKCIEMFQTLLDRTSKQHVDRLPTFSLLASMKTTLRVMQEVKAQEEEYNLIKDLSLAIEGLSSASSLARRERRLLIRGSCRLLASRSQARSQRNSNGNRHSLVLLDAVNNWDGSKRSEKRRSFLPASSPDANLNTRADSASPNQTASGGSGSGYDLVFSPVEVFVFSDVVVVVTQTGKDRWKLVEKFGTARILRVAETTVTVKGREEYVAELELVPVGDLQLEGTRVDEDTLMSTPISSIQISVDPEHQGDADRQERRKKWLYSFEKCCRATTHSLEFPLRFDLNQSLTGFGGMENFDADKYQKAMGAGPLIPKSPSKQIQTYNRRQRRRSDFARAEREERDWWSFRFKEVYLELQRDGR